MNRLPSTEQILQALKAKYPEWIFYGEPVRVNGFWRIAASVTESGPLVLLEFTLTGADWFNVISNVEVEKVFKYSIDINDTNDTNDITISRFVEAKSELERNIGNEVNRLIDTFERETGG